MPQPSLEGVPHNVIRGEFFAKGEAGWAVLCSVNNSTVLLAFRSDRDMIPDTVTTSEEKIGDGRQLTAVGRDFIVRHHRAYGGPELPPIEHHGIDDGFLQASITWYFYRSKWLRLQGAD